MQELMRLDDFWVPSHRPDQSAIILIDIYHQDSYRTCLRPKREGVEYVVDVGANIGAFTMLWRKRNPAAKFACIEVCQQSLPALRANVDTYASVFPFACTYEKEEMFLLNSFTDQSDSTGGSQVVKRKEWLAETSPQYHKDKEPLQKITLEEICHQVDFPHIDVLKLDCEGSEFSILYNCDLSKIGTIFVEAHGAARWQRLLKDCFQGWDIGHMSQNGEFGTWHLVNPNPPSYSIPGTLK